MNIFSFIKSRISIRDVASEYTNLKKAGLYWKATCPFHNEKDASFTVSPHKEIFYCFGCHAGGDVITFIEKIEGCSALEAAQFLADRYRIDIPSDIEYEKPDSTTFEEKERYFKLCSVVAQWAHEMLLKSAVAMKYLEERGINRTSVDTYGLGYFKGGQVGVNSLLQVVKKQNIMPHDLIEAHLIVEGKGHIYSPFEERIIFPIKDHLGRSCGLGGRVFKEHDERAKYYNSRENTYFQKGKLIFGLDVAKKAIQKTGELFLVEGYTDCITMRQHGYTNTISTLGTACTVEHLQMLSRYCDRVMILYDGDNAGHQAIMRLTELCWQVSLDLSVIVLPTGEDPASFLKKGGNVEEIIKERQDIFDFFLKATGKDFPKKSFGEKVGALRKILSIIASIDDSLKRTMLLQRASAVFSIPYETLQQELMGIKPKQGSNKHLQGNSSSDLAKEESAGLSEGISKLEKKIFFAIISNIQLFNNDSEGFLIGYFSDPIRSILEKLHSAKQENPDLEFQSFFDTLERDEQRLISGVLLECDQEIKGKSFGCLLDQFKRKNWKNMVRTIRTQMDSSQNSSGTSDKILKDFLELKKKIFSNDRFSKD